jgi:argininosuccinate synthase
MESLTLDREVAHLRDEPLPRYASLIDNGLGWRPGRRMLQERIDASQGIVNGTVRLKPYRGNVMAVGRRFVAHSLFDADIVTFEEDTGALQQQDADGFIGLNGLRMRLAARRDRDTWFPGFSFLVAHRFVPKRFGD